MWIPSALLVTALLMVNHVISMPLPSDITRLHNSIQNLRNDDETPLIVHVVYQNCSCTRNLLEHLADRRSSSKLQEVLLYVGQRDSRSKLAEKAGYQVHYIDRASLQSTYAIEAAPLLLVVDESGQIRYLGGYYRTPATVKPMDQEIIKAVLHSHDSAETLPLYGCAVSQNLQDQIDPLQLQQLGR